MSIYALAYERVSTEEQADSNNSIPAQRRRIEEYAAKNGITILQHYADQGASAFKDDENRVAFHEMIERAKSDSQVSLILVDDATRFYRNRTKAVLVKSELRTYGVQVRSVSMPYDPDTLHGLWLEGIDEIRAQASSMETAFATFRGMEQNAMTRDPETGWCYKNGGRAPYGYEAYHVVRGKNARGKDIVRTLWRINPQQAEIVRLILVELRGKRQLSYIGIRDELNTRGIPSPTGGLWTQSCIYEFCREERILQYAGIYFWNKEDHKTKGRRFKPKSEWKRVDNAHPAIITKEEAELALMVNRQRHVAHLYLHADKSKYLLTGKNIFGEPFFVCAKCGANMIGQNLNPGRGIPKYVCGSVVYKGKNACIYKPIPQEPLERAIIEYIITTFGDKEKINAYLKDLREMLSEENEEIDLARKSLQKQLAETQKEIDKIMDAVAKGLDPELCMEKAAALKKQRDDLWRRLANIESQAAKTKQLDEKKIRGFLEDLSNILRDGSNADKKEYIKHSIRRIEFDPEADEIRVFAFPAPVEKISTASLEAVRDAAGARDRT